MLPRITLYPGFYSTFGHYKAKKKEEEEAELNDCYEPRRPF
jgi:hypothetical protein